MKTFSFATSLWILVARKCTRVLLLLSLCSLSSCFLHYYKTNTEEKKDAAKLQELINGGKYFILHANAGPKALTAVRMNNGNIEAGVTSLAPEHTKYLRPANFQKNRFRAREKDVVLYEVHLYTHESVSNQEKISVPLNSFYRIDVYELNQEATNHSRIASTVGLVLGTAGIITLIVAASSFDIEGTSSNGNYSCSPQLYSVTDSTTSLTGILYSGAIFAPLQRTDYLPLSVLDGTTQPVRLQLHGGQNEELFVASTSLLQVTHPKGYEVLVDQKGKVLTYTSPVNSSSASVSKEEDVSAAIAGKDGLFYSFTNASNEAGASDVILNFKKPAGAGKGKLIVRAKNSTWAYHLFRKFKLLYGESYARVLERKDKADPKKLLQCEIDQSLPLSVSVKEGTQWKTVDFFYTPGNEVWRDMIMEIDLREFAADEQVQVKLETTFMFWDLDYVAMDFSTAVPHTQSYAYTKKLTRVNTRTNAREVVLEDDLRISDQEYLDLSFEIPPTNTNGQSNSFFLVGTGYYHDRTKYTGKAQLTKLARFSRKGAFDHFSRENFRELAAMFYRQNGRQLTAKK